MSGGNRFTSCCTAASSNHRREVMDSISRRQMLAVTAAGGLLTTTTIVNSQTGPFQSKPGDGGVARAATELPPGEKVAYHNPKDVADMPDFHFSLDASRPKVTSGGWAKEATVHQFPISEGIAGVHMFLDPGAARELHWHAIAAEWAYVIDGRCQTVVLDPSGASEINNYGPGDLWFFPKRHRHSIHTIGDKPCHFGLSFDNGGFSRRHTRSISDWIDLTPKDILELNFGVPKDVFDAFPKGETYIQAGPVLPASQAIDAPWPKESTHKFSLLKDVRARRDLDGGTLNLATVDEWTSSKTMSRALMMIKPGRVKQLHWNPNANEFHSYLSVK